MCDPSHGNRSTQGSTTSRWKRIGCSIAKRGAEERVESGMVKEVVSRQQQTEDTPTHLSITR